MSLPTTSALINTGQDGPCLDGLSKELGNPSSVGCDPDESDVSDVDVSTPSVWALNCADQGLH